MFLKAHFYKSFECSFVQNKSLEYNDSWEYFAFSFPFAFFFPFLTLLNISEQKFIFSGCNEAIANPNFKYLSHLPSSIIKGLYLVSEEYTPSQIDLVSSSYLVYSGRL